MKILARVMEFRTLSEMRRKLDHSTLKSKSKKELEDLLRVASELLTNSSSPQDTTYYPEIETRINSYIREKGQGVQFWTIFLVSSISALVSIVSLCITAF